MALPHVPAVISTGLGLYVAGDGAVWAATYSGAYRYDGQNRRRFTAQDGLPDNEVHDVAEDADGQLWFATEQGAAHVDPATLNLSPVDWPPVPTQ
jgi:ligand-binding sensor domain-containing protein